MAEEQVIKRKKIVETEDDITIHVPSYWTKATAVIGGTIDMVAVLPEGKFVAMFIMNKYTSLRMTDTGEDFLQAIGKGEYIEATREQFNAEYANHRAVVHESLFDARYGGANG
jgi:hypothetical protein